MSTGETEGDAEADADPDAEPAADPDAEPAADIDADADGDAATRVLLSFPADVGHHGRKRLRQDYYKKWLRKSHEAVAEGDEWDEFTDVGCCGSKMDLPLRVESVDGGSRLGPETAIEYTEREACGVNPGWSVQHDEPAAIDEP